MVLDLLDMIDDLRRLPNTVKAEATRIAVKLGVDAYPEIHALVKKNGRAWELVAVSLDPALLPPPTDGAVACVARLDRAPVAAASVAERADEAEKPGET